MAHDGSPGPGRRTYVMRALPGKTSIVEEEMTPVEIDRKTGVVLKNDTGSTHK